MHVNVDKFKKDPVQFLMANMINAVCVDAKKAGIKVKPKGTKVAEGVVLNDRFTVIYKVSAMTANSDITYVVQDQKNPKDVKKFDGSLQVIDYVKKAAEQKPAQQQTQQSQQQPQTQKTESKELESALQLLKEAGYGYVMENVDQSLENYIDNSTELSDDEKARSEYIENVSELILKASKRILYRTKVNVVNDIADLVAQKMKKRWGDTDNL